MPDSKWLNFMRQILAKVAKVYPEFTHTSTSSTRSNFYDWGEFFFHALNVANTAFWQDFFTVQIYSFEREVHLRLTYSRFSPSAQILSSTNIDIALIGHIVYPNCAGSQKHWIMKLPQSIRDSVFDIKADLFVSQLLFIPRRTHRMVWCLSQY